jgi:hypothetical protein
LYPESLLVENDLKVTELTIGETTRISLYGTDNNKIKHDKYMLDPYCEIVTEVDVEERNLVIFQALERGPLEVRRKGVVDFNVYLTPGGDEFLVSSFDDFPDFFRSLICSIMESLGKIRSSLVNIIRWRANLTGPNKLVRFESFEWSQDEIHWKRWDFIIHPPYLNVEMGLRWGNQIQDEIQELLNNLSGEPTHHKLFREAWELRHTNPQSSIVIGISAAEVAMKECITVLVPNAQWLVEEASTPPLVKMMTKYLPTLPAKNNFEGTVLAPPKNIYKAIDEGVQFRNKVVHVGRQAPRYEDIEKILLAVKDFLWLIDYYCGHSWSLQHIRKKTLKEMQNIQEIRS